MNERPLLRRILFGQNLKTTFIRASLLTLFLFLLFRWILIPVRSQTEAMSPNIKKGGLVFVSPLPYFLSPPQRGDIVAIRLAGSRVVYLSRIVAMPGEVVELRESQLYVGNERIPGPPLQLAHGVIQSGYKSSPVESDEVFVVGDWRNGSIEELHSLGSFGRVKVNQILGKVIF